MQRHPRSRQQPNPTTGPRRGGTSALLTTGSLLLFLSCSWTLTSCQAEAAANSLVLPQDEPQQQQQHQSAGSAIRDLFYRVSPEDMWDWLNGGNHNGNSGGGGQGGGGDGGGDGGGEGVPDRTDDEPAPSPSVGVPVPIPAVPPATAPFPQPLVDDNAAAADDDATRAQTVATKCQGMSLADRSTALRQAILDQTVTGAGRLDTPDNPQSVALQWIDEVDPLVLCPDAPGLVQRYTLAVLYASLGGADWTTQDGWWTGDYVCSWYGVTCETDAAAAGGTVAKVSLKANNLQGFLPSEILALPGLTGLSLDHNAIRGQIPTTLGLATTLQYIELDDNALRGTIPSELYQLTQLQAIDFNTNKLSGTLSPSIRNLSNLVVLQLEQNQLTGTIPTSALRQLNDLVLLTLHDNSWSAGSSLDGVCDFVPARRQSNPAYLQFFSSDCSDTTSCPCCSQCF